MIVKRPKHKQLRTAFEHLMELYIMECRANPNHLLNEESFKQDWLNKAGLPFSPNPRSKRKAEG